MFLCNLLNQNYFYPRLVVMLLTCCFFVVVWFSWPSLSLLTYFIMGPPVVVPDIGLGVDFRIKKNLVVISSELCNIVQVSYLQAFCVFCSEYELSLTCSFHFQHVFICLLAVPREVQVQQRPQKPPDFEAS